MNPQQKIALPGDRLRQLVFRARHGDAEAFGELYDNLYDRVYHYAYRRAYDQSAAQDITANTFYKMMTGMAHNAPVRDELQAERAYADRGLSKTSGCAECWRGGNYVQYTTSIKRLKPTSGWQYTNAVGRLFWSKISGSFRQMTPRNILGPHLRRCNEKANEPQFYRAAHFIKYFREYLFSIVNKYH